MPTPSTAPRYYAYFQAVSREYEAPGVGWVQAVPDIRWYGLASSRVLVLTHRQTPLADTQFERGRTLHEWVVVTDQEAGFPAHFETVGGYDPEGNPFPAYGVFVQYTFRYFGGSVTRDYQGRDSQYAVTDLLARPDDFGPVQLFIQGVREVISHLDNAEWRGPGSAIVYDREASFGWLTKSDAEEFELAKHARWVPGTASVYERFLMGTGTLDGWGLYALQHLLVIEFWRAGVMVASRMFDVGQFSKLLGDPDGIYTFGFGYDYPKGVISVGVAGKSSRGSDIAHHEWQVPELREYGFDHKTVYIGGAPVLYADGAQAHRTCWGWVKPIQGAFTSEDYLTKGKLAALLQEV